MLLQMVFHLTPSPLHLTYPRGKEVSSKGQIYPKVFRGRSGRGAPTPPSKDLRIDLTFRGDFLSPMIDLTFQGN